VTEDVEEPNESPGGIEPEIVQDLGGLSVTGDEESAKATGAIAVPAVTAYGLGWAPVRSVKTVAPATESTAPSEASDAAAAFRIIPAFDSRTTPARRAADWRAGARCSTAMRIATGSRRRAVGIELIARAWTRPARTGALRSPEFSGGAASFTGS